MIQVVDNNEFPKVKSLIEKHFGHIVENDPFVHYVKYEDTILKGFLSYSLIYDRIELNYIWVDDSLRRTGIGESLLQYLIELAMNQNIDNISLEVRCSNEPAISLYLKNGFAIVAKREKYYQGKDGYLMVKEVRK